MLPTAIVAYQWCERHHHRAPLVAVELLILDEVREVLIAAIAEKAGFGRNALSQDHLVGVQENVKYSSTSMSRRSAGKIEILFTSSLTGMRTPIGRSRVGAKIEIGVRPTLFDGMAGDADGHHALAPLRAALPKHVSADPLDRQSLAAHRLDEITDAQVLDPDLAGRGKDRCAPQEAVFASMWVAFAVIFAEGIASMR